MNKKYFFSHRVLAMLLTLTLCLSMIPTASAAQQNSYHDPVEHWQQASNRTNELDVNSIVTHETFYCATCRENTDFTVWRVPEYTRSGETALNRNVKYSNGMCIDEVTVGSLDTGVPGENAYYTGYHWTKSVCSRCGDWNSNETNGAPYAWDKNIYVLHDCAAKFYLDLPETVTHEYVDSKYHRTVTKGGTYCCFCYGTNYEKSSVLERHDMAAETLPQPAHGRFAAVEKCRLCDYTCYDYTAAKAVVASYYGVADGQPHTISVTDLSEAGVRTAIRYGNSADSCTMTTAPNYTDEGQYTVYYEITYTCDGVDMTENGVAYVWLRDDTTDENGNCGCGCSNPNCGCQNKHCNGNCCTDKGCGENHKYILLDSTKAGCTTLGYDRYLCTECGKIEKRDYVDSLGHAWQGIVVRDATCETDGKLLELCSRCGQMKQTATPKGEHSYEVYTVAATCTSPGYTAKECSVCGDRHIEDITPAIPHDYKAHVIEATCDAEGKTIHRCDGCGSSFVTDYTEALGHSWDKGTLVTNATCTGEGVMEYRCTRCGYHRLDADPADGHIPGAPATCTAPQLCTRCGAVMEKALGHDYKSEVTAPTCTEMGYTTNTCSRCGDTNKSNYTEPAGHKPSDWIIDKESTTDSEGSKHKECTVCGEKLEAQPIEKIYNSATTDSKGEAVVGGYLVTVTDTDTKNPVANAAVALHKDNSISIRLPNSRLLDYADQTTVTVQLVKDKSAVPGMNIAVTDKYRPYQAHPKYTGFLALYVHYLYLLGKIGQRQYPPRMTPHLRREVMRFEQYRTQFDFLRENEIVTQADMDAFQTRTEESLAKLIKQRTILNVRKKRRQKLYTALADVEALAPSKALYEEGLTGMEAEFERYMEAVALLESSGVPRKRLTEEKAEIYEQLAELNREIRTERQKLKLCHEIQNQVPVMEQDIQRTEEHQKEVREHEHRRR